MVKFMVGLIVVCGIIVVAAYYHGGVSNFDPTAQGDAAKAAIAQGMPWNGVLAAAGKPGHYRIFYVKKIKLLGEEVEQIEPGRPIKYDADEFAMRLKGGEMPEGFLFEYHFSEQSAFQVTFNAAGNVVDVADMITMADLLDTRRH